MLTGAASSSPSRAKDLLVSEATLSATASLTLNVPRGFHKINVFHRAAIPDTPLVSGGYARIYGDGIQDPICHVLTVIDNIHQEKNSSSSSSSSERQQPLALGLLLLHLIDPDDKASSGVWTKFAFAPDHDRERYEAIVVPMGGLQAEIMGDCVHLSLELFGVDDEAKGLGLGKMLLRRNCENPDEEGLDVVVEANVFAVGFHRMFGFEVVKETALPGEEGYGEAMLVESTERVKKT